MTGYWTFCLWSFSPRCYCAVAERQAQFQTIPLSVSVCMLLGRAAAWGWWWGVQYHSGLSPCPMPGAPSLSPFITGVTGDCQILSSTCQYLVIILGLPKSGLQVLAQPTGENASRSSIHPTELMASPAPHGFCRRTP